MGFPGTHGNCNERRNWCFVQARVARIVSRLSQTGFSTLTMVTHIVCEDSVTNTIRGYRGRIPVHSRELAGHMFAIVYKIASDCTYKRTIILYKEAGVLYAEYLALFHWITQAKKRKAAHVSVWVLKTDCCLAEHRGSVRRRLYK